MKRAIIIIALLLIPSMAIGQAFGGYYGPEVSTGPVFYDTFTGADDTALTDHTPDITPGGGWAGTGKITSNKAVSNSADAQHPYVETGVSNVRIVADVTTSSPEYTNGIVFKATDASNYWYFGVNESSVSDLYLVSIASGTPTVRAAVDATIVQNTSYPCTLTTNGSTHTGTAGGASVSVTYDLYGTATKHGIRLRGNAYGGGVDNLTVSNY